jgi:hypothetical protein
VGSYYAQIRSLLRDRPDLKPCLKRCKYCGILFFTDPRNAGRIDLYCGFGCRETHHRQSSARRSAAFYREHPDEKQRQNRKRYLRTASPCPDNRVDANEESPAPIVRYVRVIVSLIERRSVTFAEIVEMLAKKGRQRRMARERESGYGSRDVNENSS